MTKLMENKRGIIMGVINTYSIAWAIAKTLHEHGAQLAFTYPNERIKEKITPLANSLGSELLYECDVTKGDTIKNTFDSIAKEWGEIDFVVHAIAFSNKDELKGRYVDTTLDNFLNTMHISCYSFTEIMHHASPLMKNGGSALTLTYLGSNRLVPNYNVMGVAKAALESSVRYLAEDLGKNNIRVNSISAGPIKTLASSGVGDFSYILKWNQDNSPLRKNITTQEVANGALYLLSDLSTGTTAENMFIDAGYNIVGVKAID